MKILAWVGLVVSGFWTLACIYNVIFIFPQDTLEMGNFLLSAGSLIGVVAGITSCLCFKRLRKRSDT